MRCIDCPESWGILEILVVQLQSSQVSRRRVVKKISTCTEKEVASKLRKCRKEFNPIEVVYGARVGSGNLSADIDFA